jgi:hypothetical protein
MKKFFSLLSLFLLSASPALVAQQLVANDLEKTVGPAPSLRLDCQTLSGQVVDMDGQGLVGATLLIKGTSNAYITDGQGNFKMTAALYRKQVVAVEAAGYLPQYITLNNCTLPLITLERDPTMRIKRGGKRAGQVVRSGEAYRQ